MRKIFLAAIIALALATSATARPTLAIRSFDDRTDDAKAPASAIMDMMVTELGNVGLFDLVERERIDFIHDELMLANLGLLNPETVPQIGKVTGAQFLMTGAITMYYYDEKGANLKIPIIGGNTKRKTAYVVLDLRIFDNNSNIIYGSVQVGSASQAESGLLAEYGKFSAGIYRKREGGILAAAARDAIKKHVEEMSQYDWE